MLSEREKLGEIGWEPFDPTTDLKSDAKKFLERQKRRRVLAGEDFLKMKLAMSRFKSREAMMSEVNILCACFRMTGNSAACGPFPVMVKQAHNILADKPSQSGGKAALE